MMEASPYRPMTLVDLAGHLTRAEEPLWWRLVCEFLEEYSWEPVETRGALLADEPPTTGDEHWDVFLAALAEHLAAADGHGPPRWAMSRALDQFWFPFNDSIARAEAVAFAPAAFLKRNVFIADRELVRA